MYIGNVEIHSKLYLAPMAGVTDLAFRQICRELGAGMSCTELVSAKALCYQDKKSRGLLKLAPNEKPAAAQIFGSDIPCMAEAAVIAAVRQAVADEPHLPVMIAADSDLRYQQVMSIMKQVRELGVERVGLAVK